MRKFSQPSKFWYEKILPKLIFNKACKLQEEIPLCSALLA